MDQTAFKATLTSDGFSDVETRDMAPGFQADRHDHPFDVRAMVLDGGITLTIDGVAKAYGKGDIFDMQAGCQHEENVGAEGVRFLLGRRHPD